MRKEIKIEILSDALKKISDSVNWNSGGDWNVNKLPS